jgi:glycosyltransferase involved in cell wall biosynthesis
LSSKVKKFPTVLQVLPSLNGGGGVERGTVEIAEAIYKVGGEAIVVSSGGDLENTLKRHRAQHIRLPVHKKSLFTILANIRRLRKIIREHKVQIVHARSRAPAWSAYYAARREGVPFVTTFHGTYGLFGPFKKWYNRIMVRGDRVIANSKFIAGHIKENYEVPQKNLKIIQRGVDTDLFDPTKTKVERFVQLANKWNIPDGKRIILLPGRLTRWKGQETLIKALMHMETSDLCCIFLGSDQGRSEYTKELILLAQISNLGDVVKFVGNCDDMTSAYMMADVVVSASTDPEAFGRVIAEAQAMGRPVIATNHGGALEIIKDGITGWFVPPYDPERLAEKLQKALALPNYKREELKKEARDHILKNFTKEAMCKKTLAIYKELAASGKRK